MFDMEIMLAGRTIVMSNVALKMGSSKQGKTRRASVG